MLEEIATVMKSQSDGVWLKTQSVSSCNACQANNDCGTGVVAKALTPRENLFFVKKMYPSDAKRSFFSRKGEKILRPTGGVHPSEHKSCGNEPENPREPGFGETK